MNDNTQKRWLDTTGLFTEFGFSKDNQAKLRMDRKIPFSKIGKYIRYDRIELDKWLESHAVVKVG